MDWQEFFYPLLYKDLEKILSSKEESIFTFKNKNIEITSISDSQLSDFIRAFLKKFQKFLKNFCFTWSNNLLLQKVKKKILLFFHFFLVHLKLVNIQSRRPKIFLPLECKNSVFDFASTSWCHCKVSILPIDCKATFVTPNYGCYALTRSTYSIYTSLLNIYEKASFVCKMENDRVVALQN
jgi:hypothetical protein